MKKRVKVLLILFVTTVLLVSCKNNESLQDTKEASVEIKKESANIETITLQKDRITIKYPKLINLENEKIAEKWNKIIEDKISKDIENLSQNDIYQLNYEVASDTKEEVSIKMIGSCYYDGATQPLNFIYTYNISLDTGESIRLCNQVDIEKLASKLYQNQGFTLEESKKDRFMKYIYSAFENEEALATMLGNFDYDEDTKQSYGYSFYEADKLNLCIEVPHDLGDYVIIQLENEDK